MLKYWDSHTPCLVFAWALATPCTYIFVNEKPAIQFATMWVCTRDSTLHFVKLNSCQLQIINQTPNIQLAKISVCIYGNRSR